MTMSAGVTAASATSRAAPFAEFVEPFRSRAAAITGAEDVVDTIAISTLRPFTPL
jgi:hypothetical protein